MKHNFKYLMALALLLALTACSKGEAQGADETEKADLIGTPHERIQAAFSNVGDRYKVGAIQDAGLAGFYRVQIENGPVVYVNESAEHFFTGDLYKLEVGKMVNVSDQALSVERLAALNKLSEKDMIIFAPKGEKKGQVTVFTDVDCFYCQKLHQEVPALNERGIAVRYLAYPRAGIGSASYKKVVSAWCADNPQDAMDKLKNRQDIPQKNCENPVAAQFVLGQKIGVSGTPAILLDDGSLIPGYRPADALAKDVLAIKK